MKNTWLKFFMIGFAGMSLALTARAIDTSIFAAGRYHTESKSGPDLPYVDGDWSTTLGFEFQEGPGYWQLAVDFADGTGSTNEIGNVITPQLNLMVEDRGVAAGIGVLSTYTEDETNGDDWSDVYFQANLGLNIPLGSSLGLYGMSHFVFEDWDGISDFDFDELEYSVGLTWKF